MGNCTSPLRADASRGCGVTRGVTTETTASLPEQRDGGRRREEEEESLLQVMYLDPRHAVHTRTAAGNHHGGRLMRHITNAAPPLNFVFALDNETQRAAGGKEVTVGRLSRRKKTGCTLMRCLINARKSTEVQPPISTRG